MSRPIVLAAGCTRSDAASTAAAPGGTPVGDAASAPDAVQQAIDSLAAWPQASR